MEILRLPLHGFMAHLGYATYLAVILGIWKVLGAVVVLVPRVRRMKE